MPTLARNQASDCANPEIDIFFDVGGVATDVDSLEFIIFEDVTTPGTPIPITAIKPASIEPYVCRRFQMEVFLP